MDASTSVEGESSVELREQIHQTQLQLGEKLGALEGEVRAVTSHAKEAIRERIESVRDVIDVRRQVYRHPWLCCAIAAGIGVLIAGRAGRSQVYSGQKGHMSTLRRMAAPHIASLQTLLIGRALSFVTERLKERLSLSSTGSDSRSAQE